MESFISEIQRLFAIMLFTFAGLEICFYIFPRMPRFPWDVYIDKTGFTIYIPLISTLGFSILLSFVLRRSILPF